MVDPSSFSHSWFNYEYRPNQTPKEPKEDWSESPFGVVQWRRRDPTQSTVEGSSMVSWDTRERSIVISVWYISLGYKWVERSRSLYSKNSLPSQNESRHRDPGSCNGRCNVFESVRNYLLTHSWHLIFLSPFWKQLSIRALSSLHHLVINRPCSSSSLPYWKISSRRNLCQDFHKFYFWFLHRLYCKI